MNCQYKLDKKGSRKLFNKRFNNNNCYYFFIKKIFEKEEKWISYDDDESIVSFELTELMFDKLVEEGINQLEKIRKDRTLENYFL